MLENFYEMLSESRVLYDVEIWRVVGLGESKLGTGQNLQILQKDVHIS